MNGFDLLDTILGALLGGVVGAILTGKFAKDAQSREHDHQRALAREARQQDRRESAYEEILAVAIGTERWVAAIGPNPAQPGAAFPPFPFDEAVIVRSRAVAAAHASREVRDLLKMAGSHSAGVQASVRWSEAAVAARTSDMFVAAQKELAARESLAATMRDMEARIRQELDWSDEPTAGAKR